MSNNRDRIGILIVNGVNLSQLGTREVNIYGHLSFEDYLQVLEQNYPDIAFSYCQTDHEGELAQTIAGAKDFAGIILNAGAYTHTSVVIADAIRTTECPVIEVHISNLFGRENYRRNSQIAAYCAGFISGFGLDGYRLATEAILKKINER